MLSELLSRVLRPELREVRAYAQTPGAYRVRLDANEAPDLLSESAKRRLSECLDHLAWQRYPDAEQFELRRAIARHASVEPEWVFPGAGSDEVIANLLTAAGHHDDKVPAASIVTTTPTFVMYRLSGKVRGMRVVEVPLDDDWNISESGLEHAIEVTSANLVFLASPNNPTGKVIEQDPLLRLLSSHPRTLFILDEAYVDYADRHQLKLIERHHNVAILRTLSKLGFASIRSGWLLGAPELVRELDKVRSPYNMPTLCQRLACVVLNELAEELEVVVRTVKTERERMTRLLSSIEQIAVTPSQANFLWIRTHEPAEGLFERLKARGVLVRSFHERGGRLAHQLRVTLGTPDQNDDFLATLQEVL